MTWAEVGFGIGARTERACSLSAWRARGRRQRGRSCAAGASCERVLGDRLPLSAPAPLSPRTTLDLSQLAREPFRGDLPKLAEDVADRSERLLQELPLLWRRINPRLFRF
jgi:hypothetical protein